MEQHEGLEICPACDEFITVTLSSDRDYEDGELVEVPCPYCGAVGLWVVEHARYYVVGFDRMKGE